MSSAAAHVSKREINKIIKLDDDAVSELLTITRSIVNMFELLTGEPDSVEEEQNNSRIFASPSGRNRKVKKSLSSRKKKKGANKSEIAAANARTDISEQGQSLHSALTGNRTDEDGVDGSKLFLQRVHNSVQVDHLTVPPLFPSMLQRIRSPFERSDLAISRTIKSFHIEPDTADIARCVLYSGEVQRQLQTMFTLSPPMTNAQQQRLQQIQEKSIAKRKGGPNDDDDESIEPLRATSIAAQPSPSPASSSTPQQQQQQQDLINLAKLLCRRRGTTAAPGSPNPSSEVMLSVPAVRVRHNRGLNPVVVTLTPTHLHVRDPIKDFIQKLPWSHLTSATLGNAPGLHAFIGGNQKQSLANVTVGPRHGLLWKMARNEAQQSHVPILERKKLNLTPAQALKQSHHCINLQFSGMNIHKDSPFPIDTSRMTTHHINELWRFEIVCECQDDFALFCTFLSVVGNHHSSLWALPGLQPFTLPQTPMDRPPRVAPLKLRPTTLPEIDAAVPGGLAAWNKQQEGNDANAKKRGLAGRAGGAAGETPVIAMSEAFFRMSHTDKYARPVTLRYSARAEIPTGFGSATSHVALTAAEVDLCTENHLGRVEYIVMKQLLLGDPLNKWISIADVLGHMMVPLRAWNLHPAVKLLKFWCDLGWIERVLVLEPGPRRK